jgi:carbohydrate-selective porin OprB
VKDAIFQVTFTERTGRNLVTDAQLNTLQLVQEVWGRGQTARLTQFWYDQQPERFHQLESGPDAGGRRFRGVRL